MFARPRLTVDCDAIAANYRLLRELAAPAECAGVIKADAYGLGAQPVARRLIAENCRTFFFAHPGEAAGLSAEIRAAGGRCFILNGLGGYAPDAFAEHGLIPVLNSLDDCRAWHTAMAGHAAALHIDTGMNRLGLPESDDAAVQALQAEGLTLVHLMSHFACADQAGHPLNRTQIDRFEARSAGFGIAERSMANSAGCGLGPDAHFDLVRPGLALYGAQPGEDRAIDLAIPYRFEAPVLQIRPVAAGSTAGYGGTHRFVADGWAATIGAGYADGVPRAFSNRARVRIGDFDAPVIGRVSMDSTIVDVSAHADPASLHGASTLIYGPGLTVDMQAASAGLSAYELLTRIGGRTERHCEMLA